jgi:crossover junction endodeoxyribonuclease RuvC
LSGAPGSPNPVVVLGIDPGTAATGYGIVERAGSRLRVLDYGCLETQPAQALAVRLMAIHQSVTQLIALHRPQMVGVERLFFNRNVQTAFAVGQARGVVLLAAAQGGVPVFEYGPHEVKMAVTGYGRADKRQVQRMVQAVLGMDALPRPDDAADALAVAICLAHARPTLVGPTAA